MKRSQVEKLEDKLSERMRQLPDFVFEYLSFIGDSTEVQTRLEYAKDINIFLDFLIISGTVFCNRKVQINAIKNAEVCHP